MEWVRLAKYLHDSGESRATFYRLRDEGVLLETVHYRYDPRNRVWVNTEAMTAWVTGKVLKPKRRSVA
jgi:hypothetical protein